MTESEAIEMLRAYHKCQRLQVKGIYEDCNEKLCDSCDLCYAQGNTGEHIKSIEMAIQALEKQINGCWVPCKDRLPEDDSICIVTVEYPNNETMVDYGWFDRNGVCWFVGMHEFRTSNVLAWQPLPEPFKERD